MTILERKVRNLQATVNCLDRRMHDNRTTIAVPHGLLAALTRAAVLMDQCITESDAATVAAVKQRYGLPA